MRARPVDEASGEEMEADEEADFDEDEPAPEERGADQGHPRCTMEEDCQGSPSDILIRHLLNGAEGDIYCRTCWDRFVEMNPALEGEEVEP